MPREGGDGGEGGVKAQHTDMLHGGHLWTWLYLFTDCMSVAYIDDDGGGAGGVGKELPLEELGRA